MFRIAIATLAVFGSLALGGQTAVAQQSFRWIQDDIDVYNLEVIRVEGKRLTVRVAELQGRRTFRVPGDFKFYIDGKPTDVSQLAPRQRLTAYVARSQDGKLILVDAGPPQATPPAVPSAPPVIAEQPAAPAMAMLPKTASPLGLIGLIGFASLALATGLRMVRRRG